MAIRSQLIRMKIVNLLLLQFLLHSFLLFDLFNGHGWTLLIVLDMIIDKVSDNLAQLE